jgi:hypothetical protein
VRAAAISHVIAIASGCNQILGVSDLSVAHDGGGDGGSDGGGGIDALPTHDCAQWRFAPSNVDCADSAVADWTVDTSTTFDTDTGELTPGGPLLSAIVDQIGGGPQVRLVVVNSFAIGEPATLRIVGTHALVIQVHDNAVIGGILDASATMNMAGAGAAASCATGDGGAGGATAALGAGGGGGGAGIWYRGGSGSVGGGGAAGAGAGGVNELFPGPLTPLRAGCAGADGGTAGAALGGGGGASGGALQISVQHMLTIRGTINVSGGGGGHGAVGGSGGGGGGGGGGLLLEAGLTDLGGAIICANGGSGGEGGASDKSGADGRDAKCISTGTPTANILASAGDGGVGGASETTNNGDGGAAGAASGSTNAGGGGGGGGGAIFMRSGNYFGQAKTITPQSSSTQF